MSKFTITAAMAKSFADYEKRNAGKTLIQVMGDVRFTEKCAAREFGEPLYNEPYQAAFSLEIARRIYEGPDGPGQALAAFYQLTRSSASIGGPARAYYHWALCQHPTLASRALNACKLAEEGDMRGITAEERAALIEAGDFTVAEVRAVEARALKIPAEGRPIDIDDDRPIVTNLHDIDTDKFYVLREPTIEETGKHIFVTYGAAEMSEAAQTKIKALRAKDDRS